jgi:hypothetical protein
VLPGLLGLRHALARTLSRPIGLSGSGPTLWALYPSLGDAQLAARQVDTAIDDGTVESPGDGRPSVIATTIQSAAQPSAPLSTDPAFPERRTVQ